MEFVLALVCLIGLAIAVFAFIPVATGLEELQRLVAELDTDLATLEAQLEGRSTNPIFATSSTAECSMCLPKADK